jgi:hypothetical protein
MKVIITEHAKKRLNDYRQDKIEIEDIINASPTPILIVIFSNFGTSMMFLYPNFSLSAGTTFSL